jgi:hypothetical protein
MNNSAGEFFFTKTNRKIYKFLKKNGEINNHKKYLIKYT